MKISIPNTDKFFQIKSYNSKYFKNMKDFSIAYELIFLDFIEYVYKENDTDFLSFLKHSVKYNYMLNDYIVEKDFTINDKAIIYENNIFPNIGSFIIENYIIYVSYSNTFIFDIKNNKKFFYYGD
jgi:hypothetical protein